MTDNEIIKALGCCTNAGEEGCGHCYFNINRASCITNCMKSALVLIARQKAEIERLEKGELSKAMTFNSKTISNAVNEEIKEFAERLKKHQRKMKGYGFSLDDNFWDFAVLTEDIDNLVKEVTGGEG